MKLTKDSRCGKQLTVLRSQILQQKLEAQVKEVPLGSSGFEIRVRMRAEQSEDVHMQPPLSR